MTKRGWALWYWETGWPAGSFRCLWHFKNHPELLWLLKKKPPRAPLAPQSLSYRSFCSSATVPVAVVPAGDRGARLKLKFDGVVSKSIGGPIPNESRLRVGTVRLHAGVTSLDLDRATHRLAASERPSDFIWAVAGPPWTSGVPCSRARSLCHMSSGALLASGRVEVGWD